MGRLFSGSNILFSRIKEAFGVFMCLLALVDDTGHHCKSTLLFSLLHSLFSCHSVNHWTSSPWEVQEMGLSPIVLGRPFRDTDVWRTAEVL